MRAKGIKRMLDDIRQETRLTHSYIGKERLAETVLDAMQKVPRERFVPKHLRSSAWDNGPLPIGHGQTISQPFIVALMTDLLQIQPEHRVLEIGTGSGYQSAILAELANEVFTVEKVEALADQARETLQQLGYSNIHYHSGNGYAGWAAHAPYDGIIVTAAASHIPPALVEQLKPGGRLVIPVGLPYTTQQLMLVEKDAEGGTSAREMLPVAFVPLVDDSETGEQPTLH